MSNTRPLGENQKMALDSLRRHGPWPGGWYITNTSTTVRILESLVRRGLVTKHEVQGRRMTTTSYRLAP